MKIAMIIEAWEPVWGGGQVHVLELSKKLAVNHNCEIDIFTMNLPNKKGSTQKHLENFSKGKIRIIRVGKTRKFESIKDRLFWIFEVINEIKRSHKKKELRTYSCSSHSAWNTREDFEPYFKNPSFLYNPWYKFH